MSWVIATLLALILVALMASDKSAAVAVRRVIRVAFVGAVGLGVTLAIALFFVWFHFGFANEDWWQTAPALLVFLTFALFAWTARKEIAAEYRKDRRRALMGVAKLLAYVGLLLVAGYMLKLILEAFQLSGWWLVVAALAGSGLLLLIRTAASPMRWRQVWFGPADVPEPWQVVESARWQAEQEERAIYDKEAETWDDLTSAEQDALWARRNERASAIESHLAAVQQQAEAATASAKAESGEWNMRTVFWLFALFGGLGLIPLLWRLGFDWAMTWHFVKGRGWMAGAVVIGGGLAIAGLVISIFEDGGKFIRERQRDKDKGANVS